MVACCDMVVTIVLDALLCIPAIKVELFDDLTEQLLLDGHLLFTREEASILVPVLHLERPRVITDFSHAEALLGVRVQDASDKILALT